MTSLNIKEKITTLSLITDEIQTLVISAEKLQDVVLELNGRTEDVREEFYEFLATNDGGVSFNLPDVISCPDFPCVERALKAISSVAPQLFSKIHINIDYMDFIS